MRLNLRGRERDGIVEETEREQLLDRIAAGLMSFREPDGEPVVKAVHRVGAELEGERVGQLPDLVAEWPDRPSAGLSVITSPEFGEVVRRGVGTGRSGNHDTDAWAVVARGSRSARELGRAPRITDIPVTACAALGVETGGMAGESVLDGR